MKKWLLIVLLVLLIILFGVGITAYYYVFVDFYDSDASSNTNIGGTVKKYVNKTSIAGIDEINFLLTSLGAGSLHNPPLSSDTPKIRAYIDDRIFNTEIIDGRFYTKEGGIDNEDIIIRSTNQEVMSIVLSDDLKNAVKASVRTGKTSIEMVTGKIKLAAKGYLKIYENVAGESIE